MRYLCRLKRVLIVVILILILSCSWKIARITCVLPDTLKQIDVNYDKNEQTAAAISMCQLAYGCEKSNSLKGTVNDILNNNEMGIFTENSMVVRADPNDPNSALFDTTKI